MLAGVPLTDQRRAGTGNLVVWPGSHRAVAGYLRGPGPLGLAARSGRPGVESGPPVPVCAGPGDLILSSYLLIHESGPNLADPVRCTAYFRLAVTGHATTWRSAVTDELAEFDAVRGVVR